MGSTNEKWTIDLLYNGFGAKLFEIYNEFRTSGKLRKLKYIGMGVSAPVGFAILILLLPCKWLSMLNSVYQNKPCLTEADRKTILSNGLKNVLNMRPSQFCKDPRNYLSDPFQKVELLVCQSEFDLDPQKFS